MDLTSTRRGLTRVTSRFRGLRYTCTPTPLKGAIQPAFNAWIRNHWSLSTLGWFRPVAKDLYKQKSPDEPVRWTHPHRVGLTGYTFSPTIQLTCFSGNSNNTLFEIYGARIFQSLTMQLIDSAETKAGRLPDDSREEGIRVSQSLVFVDGTGGDANLRRQHLGVKTTRVQELVSSLFSTVFRNMTGVTRSLVTLLRTGSAVNEGWKVSGNGRLEVTRPTRGMLMEGLVTKPSADWFRATPAVRRLMKTFLMLRRAFHNAGEPSLVARFFPTMALKYRNAEVAEADVINHRIARFVSSPVLTYAKREKGFSEEVMHALRELRAAQMDQKPVVLPQLPSIENLTNQVRTQLERDLRIERERRGI